MSPKIIFIIFLKIEDITLDPDPDQIRPTFWIRGQCIWMHETGKVHRYCCREYPQVPLTWGCVVLLLRALRPGRSSRGAPPLSILFASLKKLFFNKFLTVIFEKEENTLT